MVMRLVLLMGLFGGCGGGNETTQRIESWAKAACACDNKECAELQFAAFKELAKGLQGKESVDREAEFAHARRGARCLIKAGLPQGELRTFSAELQGRAPKNEVAVPPQDGS